MHPDALKARVVAAAQIAAVLQATAMRGAHPMIGRVVRGEIRELTISHGKSGCLALYRFVAQRDLVRVLRIRHRRELGYSQ